MKRDWTVADRISDRIVDVINDELARMKAAGDLQPLQLLAGQLLAFMALFSTIPQEFQPRELTNLQDVVEQCLRSMANEGA